MEMEITNLPLFKLSMEFLERINDVMVLHFIGKDILIKGMDPSRVTLIKFRLKNILKKPANEKIFLSLENLKKLWEHLEGDILTIEQDEKFLILKVNNETFKLILPDVNEPEEISLEKLEKYIFDASFSFDLETMSKIVEKAFIFSEILNIHYNSDGIHFNAIGPKGEYTRDDGMKENMGNVGSSLIRMRNTFIDSEFLFTGQFTLHLKTDKPLKIEFEDPSIEFKQWLAPIVEEDDVDDWSPDELKPSE